SRSGIPPPRMSAALSPVLPGWTQLRTFQPPAPSDSELRSGEGRSRHTLQRPMLAHTRRVEKVGGSGPPTLQLQFREHKSSSGRVGEYGQIVAGFARQQEQLAHVLTAISPQAAPQVAGAQQSCELVGAALDRADEHAGMVVDHLQRDAPDGAGDDGAL